MERVDAAVVTALQERGLSFELAGDKIRLVHNPKFAYSLGTDISKIEPFRVNRSNLLVDSQTSSITLMPNTSPDSKDLLLKCTDFRKEKPVKYFKISPVSTGIAEAPKAPTPAPAVAPAQAGVPVEAAKAPNTTPAPAPRSPAPAGTFTI